MKAACLLATAIALVVGTARVDSATWLTSLDPAKAQAAATGRPILINFTGSDWCPACISLRKDVFDTAEFGQLANAQLVLLEVDFPHYRPMATAQRQANDLLARK